MITVDQEKCTGCGFCERDCLLGEINIVNGKCEPVNRACYDCGHCIAICPEHAIFPVAGKEEIIEYSSEDFSIEPERLLNFIKFKRTVRKYQNRPVEKEILEKILEAGRFSPTGRNSQSVRYVVMQEELPVIRKMGLDTLNVAADRVLGDADESKLSKIYAQMWKDMHQAYTETGEDRLFYGAPAVIFAIASEKKSPATARIDAAIACSNAQLMAQTLNLGSCYIGFMSRAEKENQEISEYLGIRKNEILVTCFSIGYPAVTYYRTVAKREAQIDWR